MIYVGTCGFCERIKSYFNDYETVEIQKTFYRIIEEKTLLKWKKMSPSGFIFNFKVFQGITHPKTSPTWKRSNLKLDKLGEVGNLTPNTQVMNFWKRMLRYQKILEAKVLVIQLPRSFDDTEKNISNAEKFFEKIERGNFEIGIELRGWGVENIKKLCRKYDLIDVTDPIYRMPLSKKKKYYFRLHGMQKNGRIDYRYEYTKKDLLTIKNKILSLKAKEIYLMFNNVQMKKNSKEMKEILKLK